MANRVIIHPGYPKTGSTTLQGVVFPALCTSNGWFYFGKEYGPGGVSKTQDTVREFLRSFPQWDEIYVRRNARQIRRHFGFDQPDTMFVSLEELTLRSFKGEIAANQPVLDDLFTAFRKLKALFAESRQVQVLLTIRRQSDFLPSLYAQGYAHYYRHISETRTLDAFLHNLQPAATYPTFFSPLFYDEVVVELQRLFGGDAVAVLPFELLRDEPKAFLAAASRFLATPIPEGDIPRLNTRRERGGWKSRNVSALAGIRRARGRRNARIKLPPQLRRPVVNFLNAIPLRRPTVITATAEQHATIAAAFETSNRHLSELIQTDLSRWEYY